mgnify:CR=1 FL=1
MNWISNGRAGWNIVTALDGNRNFGLSAMPTAEERYERAAEFTEVVRLLWESYPHDALKANRASGRYADSSAIRPIEHEGRHFSVQGPLNLPAFGDTPIPLIQAGASEAGRDFASSVADAIFASTPDRDSGIELRKDLRRRAGGHARKPDDIRVLPGLSLYLAENRAQARELFAETHARMEKPRKLASIREMTGLDLTDWPEDRPVAATDLPPPPAKVRSRTHSDLLRRLILREELTVGELLLRPEVIGSAHWQIIGTVGDAVEEIAAWAEAGAMDGFVCVPGGSADSMRLALEGVVPGLVEAGLFRDDYSGSTFAGHLRDDEA